jgi:exosortase B
MAGVLDEQGARDSRMDWLPVLAGLLLLYVPAFYGIARWHWGSDEGGHGPIVLGVIAWLCWTKRAAWLPAARATAPFSGYAVLLAGLAVYVVGRALNIPVFEIGSLAPLLAGAVLVLRGWPGLRALWFPILLVAFLVPLPGVFVDSMTGPLKQQVSVVAENALYWAGYPVGRSGVLITIGPYQLLVADACAGLHSMFSLSALGMLFMYLTARKSLVHNALMLASILPIAFVANIVRVILLMLITFHYGDAAGQGFLHGATGILLLLVALTLLMALDAALAAVLPRLRPTLLGRRRA